MITRLAKSSWWFLWYKMWAVNLPRRTLQHWSAGGNFWSWCLFHSWGIALQPGSLASCLYSRVKVQLWERAPTSLTFPSPHTQFLLSLGADTLSFLGQRWAFVNICSQKDLAGFFYTKHVYLLPRSLRLMGIIFFLGVTVLLLSTGDALWSSLLCWGRARIPWRISNVQCNWLDINIWVLNI